MPRGLRTPEDAFRRPILEALVELGGKASLSEVLDLVGTKMRSKLTRYDHEPLPSDPKSIRWRNTAQWCRNTLVREGLMKSDSPHGIWEITEAGKKWLKHESPQ
ncbi:MAG: winged helix-turn-helix domain-containing protein [Spirochaetota bacterium]